MDTVRWKSGDEFRLLDLVARFRFKTVSSLSFQLGKLVDRTAQLPEIAGTDWEALGGSTSVFQILGWLDAHHPCDGFHHLHLRIGPPNRYVSWGSIRDIVPHVREVLGLPADVSYCVELAGLSRQVRTEEPQTEFGSVERVNPTTGVEG